MNSIQDPGHSGAKSSSSIQRSSFWRKLGGGSLTVSLMVHALLLIAGVVWVFQIIPNKEDHVVPFIAARGGSNSDQETTRKAQAMMERRNAARVAAQDEMSPVVLPEPEMLVSMNSLPSIGGGDSAGVMGNMRGAGDPGNGRGPWIGPGDGGGLRGEGEITPFGMHDPNANSLEGSFYDLKQTRDKHSTDMTHDGAREVIRDFVNHGWREKSLEKYYKAGRSLYQTRFMMPLMQAENAPAAFDCGNEVQPGKWIVVYRGVVTPPKTARYRFVGAGDDVLVVRFNGRHVFDHGFTSGTTGVQIANNVPFFKGAVENDNLRKLIRRDYPMKLPVTYYSYDTTRNWNQEIGGLAVGAEFEAIQGKSYPIEILISEIPGGLFCASLLIEEVGANYRKTATGAPVLPLFRLDHGQPVVDPKADNAPPFDPEGPVWKRLNEHGRAGI